MTDLARIWHGRGTGARGQLTPRNGESAPDLGPGRLERVTGIEPALSAWEADVLPLNYTREWIAEVSRTSPRPAIRDRSPGGGGGLEGKAPRRAR